MCLYISYLYRFVFTACCWMFMSSNFMVRELRAVNSIYSLNTLLEESFLTELVSLYQRNLYTKWNEVLLIRIFPNFFIWGEGLVHPNNTHFKTAYDCKRFLHVFYDFVQNLMWACRSSKLSNTLNNS